MAKIRCPRCDNFIHFPLENPEPGRSYRLSCPECGKELSIRIKTKANSDDQAATVALITIIENEFCHKQTLPLHIGPNTIGRRCKGTEIEAPIETGDMSMDRRHCVINITSKDGQLKYSIKDNRSVTGTFLTHSILGRNEEVNIEDGAIVTIGATTFIFKTVDNAQEE